MKFHNKNYNYAEKQMSGIERGTIKDPTDFEKKQMELFSSDKLKELKEKVNEIEARKEEVAKPVAIPFNDQMTFWNYLNDTQIGEFNPTALTKANTWLVTKTGTWLIQKNRAGYYAVKKNDKGIPTLPAAPEYPTAFFDLTYGKVPNTILQQIITFFRDIMKKYNDAEAFVQVYWDKQENKYICHVPKQKISKGQVRYDAEENLDRGEGYERYVFVYECHSHNSMPAFWSSTDDADEKELRIYGVFGQLNKDDYMNRHRFFVGEEQVDLDISLVFDMPKEEEKKYVVTHNAKQYMVNGSKLILDEKPKYIYENERGEKFYVPVENVVACKPKAEFPETWFKNINVAFASENSKAPNNYLRSTSHATSHSTNKYGMPILAKKDKGPAKDYSQDPFHVQDNVPHLDTTDEGIDYTYEQMFWEIGQTVDEVMALTNDFMDEDATYCFLEAVEAAKSLKTLDRAIQAYYVKSRQLDEGPSDGKYSR